MDLSQKVIYQIYPRSFQDSNGDGIGDLRGIIQRLDYLQKLGIDMIWLSPFYPSPQNDNGYDVSNYTAIDPQFGTMSDFEELVIQAKKHEIEIMLDMVFNHTSTEHEWFQKALAGDKEYQDFYYIRPLKEDGSLPTNWQSKFGGPAWEKFGETDLYYLHLYDKTQADLNWHNPKVRKSLQEVVKFWMNKGVKGFRFDVLNVIGKAPILVDSQQVDINQEKALYTDTPIVGQWIEELNQTTFGQDASFVTVGEMSSTTIDAGISYTNPTENKLSMIFSFHHLKVDYEKGEKWSNSAFDFIQFKKIIDDWQVGMFQGHGWNALFLNNHDQPRANSRFGDTDNYPFETATMLAQMIHFLRGTPYIYQGEEIGMTNPNFSNIEQYQDVETKNYYRILKDKGLGEEEIMSIIQAKSRDNSRTPMQWSDQIGAGFTKGEPWLAIANNFQNINAKKELNQEGIFHYYQQLIRLRKENPIIQKGSYRGLYLDDPHFMVYVRKLESENQPNQELLVICHFGEQERLFTMPKAYQNRKAKSLLGNGPLHKRYNGTTSLEFGPYETVAYLFKE
ncbi:alpha,alpha-phosphotrehalase [Facklamia miroungae]|uniref:Alpha,alpha-phosphotrehalase n=1 Tax=Facklamia miroungae TaxID=120956 RepID=A0A1G7SZU5_9LACT|nr:alpha,alpha-phosphotrehalase [Facklamia miroungae]NKZ29490.1 alpha,alpha-phosphotrehalase [Facklamia miroungae]SDG27919.1 trehalose-6-phosphate hydrolase [Facklamia miroungae]